MFDIVLSFNTSYFNRFFKLLLSELNRGQLVTKRLLICLNYLKFWFWIDLLSSFPYDMVIDTISQGASAQDL